MSEELYLTECTGTKHGVVEWRDSLDGYFCAGWLVDCGSGVDRQRWEEEEREEDSHDDAVRAFADYFHAAVVGCDFEVFHYGYDVGDVGEEGRRDKMKMRNISEWVNVGIFTSLFSLYCSHPMRLAFRMQTANRVEVHVE